MRHVVPVSDSVVKPLAMVAALLWTIGVPVAAQAQQPLTDAEQALMQFSYVGNLEEVQRLVSQGTAVDVVDAERRTPLMWAAFNGHTSVARFLLAEGAKLNARDLSGRTALMYASSGPYPQTVELLLKEGAEVNVQGKREGFTALMTAAAEGQLEIVRMLLAYGADPDLEDADGDTAASFARQNGHSAVVELLENPPPESSVRFQ